MNIEEVEEATGKPVVAFKIPTLEELVEDGLSGFLVESRDVEGMAQRVRDILSDPLLHQRMSARARQIAQDRFDAKRNTRQLGEIYQRILANG